MTDYHQESEIIRHRDCIIIRLGINAPDINFEKFKVNGNKLEIYIKHNNVSFIFLNDLLKLNNQIKDLEISFLQIIENNRFNQYFSNLLINYTQLTSIKLRGTGRIPINQILCKNLTNITFNHCQLSDDSANNILNFIISSAKINPQRYYSLDLKENNFTYKFSQRLIYVLSSLTFIRFKYLSIDNSCFPQHLCIKIISYILFHNMNVQYLYIFFHYNIIIILLIVMKRILLYYLMHYL